MSLSHYLVGKMDEWVDGWVDVGTCNLGGEGRGDGWLNGRKNVHIVRKTGLCGKM
jgi:hypothetical protein